VSAEVAPASRRRALYASLVLGVMAAPPVLLSPHWLTVTNLALIAAVGAVALNLLVGDSGQVSLGQAAFLAIGAFTAVAVTRSLPTPFPVAVAVAGIAGGVVGLLVGLPSLRFRALYIAVTTLALHFAVAQAAAIYQRAAVGADAALLPAAQLGPWELGDPTSWYVVLVVVLALTLVGVTNVKRSFIGRRWIAAADNRLAAAALGVPVARVRLEAFVVSSALVAMAGALNAYHTGVVTGLTYQLGLAISYLAMIVVGGLGSVSGAVLGAFVIVFSRFVMDEVLEAAGLGGVAGYLSGLPPLLHGVIIIVFLLAAPGGAVVGLREAIRRLSARPEATVS
jgi:branched-chain amino acid transport system permease protein